MSAALIRVTRTFGDGSVETWQQQGDTEPHMRRRLGASGRTHRRGTGWVERDYDHDGLRYVERIEWVTP